MRELLLCAVLASAAPASAQVVFDASEVAKIGARAKSLRERLAPADVDPEPVRKLFDRLAKDGAQVEAETGMLDLYQRLGKFDAKGKLRNLQVGVVELEDPADAQEAPMARHAVYRRYFSRMEARNEDWSVKPDGSVRVDVWDWTLSLDGRMLAVKHTIVPMVLTPAGMEVLEGKARAYLMSPADPAVQRRWKRVAKELLTLGRTVEA